MTGRGEMRITGGGSGETWHRKGYHRFFEGYTEFKVMEEGRRRVKRIYTSDYYICGLTEGGKMGIRVLYIVLAGLALMLFLQAGLRRTAVNSFPPVNFLQALCVALLAWFFISLGHYAVSFRRMEIRQYRNAVIGLKHSAFAAAGGILLQGLAALIYILAADSGNMGEGLLLTGMLAGAAACLFTVGRVEGAVPYEREKSQERVPEGAEDVYCIRG